jgi:hypothetical protein
MNINFNRNLIYKEFVKYHYPVLYHIYNTIFKEYQSTLDLNTFISFALDTSSQNVRLYKNKSYHE